MDHVMKWWGGYLLVELTGYSPERLLNLCCYNGIELWDLICVGGKYQFFVRRSDFKRLVGFVRKSKTRLIILEKHGLPFQLHRHRKRRLFAVGILLCLLLLQLFSLHIWQIEFDGNIYFTDELLSETLTEQGYVTGMKKAKIVCDDLEMMLRETYPEITWVSAQISGTRLVIQIRENTGILTVEETEEIPCDLIASCDGVITEIITRSGTPQVKAGDTVTAGQVLISGVVELYNDSKEKVGEHLVQADGDVLASSILEYEDRFPLEYPVKWYTGREKYGVRVNAFGKNIRFDRSEISENVAEKSETNWLSQLKNKVPFLAVFQKFDSVTTEGQLSIGERLLLPISWQLTTYREYEESSGIYSREQAISLAEENCSRFFENLLQKGVQIIEKNVRIDMMGDECVAQGTVTVVREIGQAQPIAQNAEEQEETDSE